MGKFTPEELAKMKADLKAEYGKNPPDDSGSLAAWVKADEVEPQQPYKSLRQKINKVFDDNSRSADEHEECIPREYYKEVVSEILALIQPQQLEGELVDCSRYDDCSNKVCGSCEVYIAIQAQHAHDKARMVTLPSEERAADIVEALDKKFPPLSDTRLAGLELLRLLKGEAKP